MPVGARVSRRLANPVDYSRVSEDAEFALGDGPGDVYEFDDLARAQPPGLAKRAHDAAAVVWQARLKLAVDRLRKQGELDATRRLRGRFRRGRERGAGARQEEQS